MSDRINAGANPDYFLDSASGAFVAGKTLSSFGDVKRIMANAAEKNLENGLVIHFHGGLVKRQYALDNIVLPLTTGYLQHAKAYPLFFVWQSGFIETLINNKGELLKDPTFRELVKKVTEFTIKKTSLANHLIVRGPHGTSIENVKNFREKYDQWFDGKETNPPVPDAELGIAGSTAPLPVVRASAPKVNELELEVLNSIQGDPAFKDAFAQAYNAIVSQDAAHAPTHSVPAGNNLNSENILLGETTINEIFPRPISPTPNTNVRGIFDLYKVAKYVTKIILAVLKRFRENRDHGVYCTVVEEVLRNAFLDLVGTNVWNQMKNDTLQSFSDEQFAGAAVVNELKAMHGKGLDRVTLVGHSTGAIYICNFLDAAKKAGVPMDKWQVIFLAPAVTCQRFAQAIKEHGSTGLRNFRMFTMKDSLESQDTLVPILYTRSLLYFVSGLLEGVPNGNGWDGILDMPLVGMQRFVDGNQNFQEDEAVQAVLNFLRSPDNPNRVVWSATHVAEEGLSSSASKHGDFDNDELTLASLYQLISTTEV